MQVTGVPQQFSDYPLGTSPKDLVATNGPPVFLTTFGLTRRDVLEARPQTASLSQSLHLMNNEGIREKIEKPANILATLLDTYATDHPVVDALYLRAYSRTPEPKQWNKIEAFLESERAAGRTRRRSFENLLWVILNSKEFQLNL
jgi:hypothetical protein